MAAAAAALRKFLFKQDFSHGNKCLQMQFQAELFIFFLGQFRLATHGAAEFVKRNRFAAKPVLPMQGLQVLRSKLKLLLHYLNRGGSCFLI